MILIVRCEKLMPSCACSRLIVIKIRAVCEGVGWQWPIAGYCHTARLHAVNYVLAIAR